MPKYNTGQDFDEAFISGLQFQQKINLQRDELQQDIMFKIRQQSLLEDFRNKSMAQDQSQFESGLALKQQGLTQEQEQFETKKELDLLKLNEDTRQFDKTLGMKEKQFDKELGLGYSKLAQDRKEFDLLYPVKVAEAETNRIEAIQKGKDNSKEVSKLVGELNLAIENDDNSAIVGRSEQLIELTGLKGDTNIIWQDIKDGYGIDESINTLNEFRKKQGKPEYTKDEKNYLKLYFRGRNR